MIYLCKNTYQSRNNFEWQIPFQICGNSTLVACVVLLLCLPSAGSLVDETRHLFFFAIQVLLFILSPWGGYDQPEVEGGWENGCVGNPDEFKNSVATVSDQMLVLIGFTICIALITEIAACVLNIVTKVCQDDLHLPWKTTEHSGECNALLMWRVREGRHPTSPNGFIGRWHSIFMGMIFLQNFATSLTWESKDGKLATLHD